MKIRKSIFYVMVILICGLIYVLQYWSPSSYGLVLRQIGVENVGIVFGQPRPIRSDEWAVVTPLTQATVNNHFERINQTSFYKEDLRINYGLPIFDWGLAFKPTMWLYLMTDPAHAYSFHWFAVMALFIVGHALLFAKFGLGEIESILLSIGLYFTGFTQFWWNEKGPVLAIFPWVVWILLLPLPLVTRLGFLYWISVSWLITNFYPPIFISLAFVGLLCIVAIGREWLQLPKIALLLATCACASLTVALYLKNYLIKTSQTLYPGNRNVSGGTVPWQEWWSQLFPFATFDWGYNSIIGRNICAVGVVGAALVLMTLCFLDYGNFLIVARESSEARWRLTVLGLGMLMMTAWMLLPLPPWVGVPLLWNNVQPERMLYAAGLLLLLIIAILGREVGIRITRRRLIVYLSLVIAGWFIMKSISLLDWKSALYRSNDLIVIPIFLLFFTLNKKCKFSEQIVLLAASTTCGIIVLFSFNPIQSSEAFFIRHDTEIIRAIEQEIQQPSGVLAISSMGGAVLNGLGYASVSHVTAVPALDFWRQKYKNMTEDALLAIFNRYSHIVLIANPQPVLLQPDKVGVPLADFYNFSNKNVFGEARW